MPIHFETQSLPFRYEQGRTGLCWPAEVTGGGVGLLDYDGDGDLDLFFAQGGPLLPCPTSDPPADTLLRNDGDGKFADVSAEVGLVARGYGQGLAVGDYDGDGDPDVYVTRLGPDTLWRNVEGRFVDATSEAGLGCPLWGLGAAFLDYDGDGDLDLFVANYFTFDESEAPYSRDDAGRPDYGTPANWQGVADVLYRNDGGRFVDVTNAAGIVDDRRGMGVLAADFDLDGFIDLLVANDAEPNSLWRNQGDGTFVEIGIPTGIAYNELGTAEANMGIAHGDTDGDGRRDIEMTHYIGEHDTLWRLLSDPGQELAFQDQTKASNLVAATLPLTTWGNALADFDADGHLDLLLVGGHIRRELEQGNERANPALLMAGGPIGRFRDVTAGAGPFFRQRHEARGLAVGDLDLDGDLDAVVVRHEAPAVVLWNQTARINRSISIELIDLRGRRDPVCALVRLTAGGRSQIRSIDGGGSYLSCSSQRLHFGLGSSTKADQVTVHWPSGRIDEAIDLPAGGLVRWVEGTSPRLHPDHDRGEARPGVPIR